MNPPVDVESIFKIVLWLLKHFENKNISACLSMKISIVCTAIRKALRISFVFDGENCGLLYFGYIVPSYADSDVINSDGYWGKHMYDTNFMWKCSFKVLYVVLIVFSSFYEKKFTVLIWVNIFFRIYEF